MSIGSHHVPPEIQALPYRRGVGICLINPDGLIFAGERIDTPGAWQMPQGGIDEDEDVEDTLYRELYEETGIRSAELFRLAIEPMRYDLPPDLQQRLWGGKYRGQEQIWAAMAFTGEEAEVNLHAHEPAEFAQWKWMKAHQLMQLIVPFKRPLYQLILKDFGEYLA